MWCSCLIIDDLLSKKEKSVMMLSKRANISLQRKYQLNVYCGDFGLLIIFLPSVWFMFFFLLLKLLLVVLRRITVVLGKVE